MIKLSTLSLNILLFTLLLGMSVTQVCADETVEPEDQTFVVDSEEDVNQSDAGEVNETNEQNREEEADFAAFSEMVNQEEYDL